MKTSSRALLGIVTMLSFAAPAAAQPSARPELGDQGRAPPPTQAGQPTTGSRARPPTGVQRAAPQRTIENLRAAIQGEATAAARYLRYAQQADQEGHPHVAKLFRAAAVSEWIHRRNEENVLRQLGVEPSSVRPEAVDVGSTQQNLLVPIQGEREEALQMYPRYMQIAQQEGVPGAVQAFADARDTEAVHDRLFREALANLGHNPDVSYWAQTESGILSVQPRAQGPAASPTGQPKP